jgi:hypothetical protein
MTTIASEPPNKRLKLPAPVIYGRIAFVNVLARRRSLGAIRYAAQESTSRNCFEPLLSDRSVNR